MLCSLRGTFRWRIRSMKGSISSMQSCTPSMIPNLTSLDRFVLGLLTLFSRPHRIPKLSVIVKPSTLFRLHKALVDRKYDYYSHPRVIDVNRVRRDHPPFFWNSVDLTRKLAAFRDYNNEFRVHRSLGGTTPARQAGAASPPPAAFNSYAWQQHCQGLFQAPVAVD